MLKGFSEDYLLTVGLSWVSLVLTLIFFIYLRPWRWTRKIAKWAARLALSLWITGLLLLALETGFALSYDTTDSFGLAKTSQRWYVRHVERNNMGFRDRKDFSTRRPSGVKRVLVIGDSFTFGHGVANIADRFTDQLEKRSLSEFGKRVEWYNCSEPGLSTKGQLEQLQRFQSMGIEFDSVLLVYNLNDVEDLFEDSKIIIGTIILDHQPQNILCREAYLPNFLYYRSTYWRRPDVTNYFHWLPDAYSGPTWTIQQSQWDQLRALCREADCSLEVVVFPFLHNLKDNGNFKDIHAAIKGYWTEHQVPFLDLLPVMTDHADESLVVNKFDAHPNERAHQLAFEAIWDRFRPVWSKRWKLPVHKDEEKMD